MKRNCVLIEQESGFEVKKKLGAEPIISANAFRKRLERRTKHFRNAMKAAEVAQ